MERMTTDGLRRARGLRALLMAFCLAISGLAAAAARAAEPGANAIEIPAWFKETFLDIGEDVREAAAEGRRLMLYFGQDGCPYCRELMRVNFAQKEIADLTRRKFNAVAINIWGDREVTWTDGRARSEKEFAALMKVQFTPTLLFFDEKGAIALRVNGYYPPHTFRAALDYVAGRNEGKLTFAEYLKRHPPAPASGRLHDEPFFAGPPYRFSRAPAERAKPLLVFFEQKVCGACDELHARGLNDRAVRELLRRFDVARLELFGTAPVVTPAGEQLTEARWGGALGVAYTPTLVFFDASGKEVFRMEASFRPFHLASGLEYVASGAYLKQPNFQRYVQQRAERIRASGARVELWEEPPRDAEGRR
jgi:thioredoxin-related protein